MIPQLPPGVTERLRVRSALLAAAAPLLGDPVARFDAMDDAARLRVAADYADFWKRLVPWLEPHLTLAQAAADVRAVLDENGLTEWVVATHSSSARSMLKVSGPEGRSFDLYPVTSPGWGIDWGNGRYVFPFPTVGDAALHAIASLGTT